MRKRPSLRHPRTEIYDYLRVLFARIGEQFCIQCGQRVGRGNAQAMVEQIMDLTAMTVGEAHAFMGGLPLQGNRKLIAEELLREIVARLGFLINVGLDYLTLSRKGPTLSGGESQRIRLASQVGSELTGVLYILDEPTTGLHFEDIRMLLTVLQRLVDGGNTVIIIEHNLDVIKTADWIIDLGPEGGSGGGRIVAEGPPEAVAGVAASYTGRYLRELVTEKS